MVSCNMFSSCKPFVKLPKLFNKSAQELISFCAVVGLTLISYFYGIACITRVMLTESNYALPVKILLVITPTWFCYGVLGNLYYIWKRDSFALKLLPVPFQLEFQAGSSNNTNAECAGKNGTDEMLPSKSAAVEVASTSVPYSDLSRWHSCDKCKIRVPPRCWHCDHCNSCILRREHHCKYAMTCIGEENHANFVGFLLYSTLGTTYGYFLGAVYKRDFIDGTPIWLTFVKSLSVIYPFIIEFGFHNILVCLLLGYVFFSFNYLMVSINLAVHGQTSYDFKKKISRLESESGQPTTWYQRFQDSLGTYPVLRIIIPFFPRRKITYEYNADCDLEDSLPNNNYMELFMNAHPNYTLGNGTRL